MTHIVLDADEALTDVGSGLGGDCSKPEAAWCIAAQAGGRNIFVKPKSTASAPNNLAIVTDRRTHAFRFVVIDDSDKRVPAYRLTVRSPAPRPVAPARPVLRDPAPGIALPVEPPRPSPQETVALRLQARPEIANSSYSIAQGDASEDIVPTLIFDDQPLHLLPLPNREAPAVFQVLGDGSEVPRQRADGGRPAGRRPGRSAADAARRIGRRRGQTRPSNSMASRPSAGPRFPVSSASRRTAGARLGADAAGGEDHE